MIVIVNLGLKGHARSKLCGSGMEANPSPFDLPALLGPGHLG